MPYACNGDEPSFRFEPSDIAITRDSQRLGLFTLVQKLRYSTPENEVLRNRLLALLVPAIHEQSERSEQDD